MYIYGCMCVCVRHMKKYDLKCTYLHDMTSQAIRCRYPVQFDPLKSIYAAILLLLFVIFHQYPNLCGKYADVYELRMPI